MADRIENATGVIEILRIALFSSKQLLEFINCIRGAPNDIAAVSTDLKALYEVLGALAGMENELGRNGILFDHLRTPLKNCVDMFGNFMTTLRKNTVTTREGFERVAKWQSITWAFREKEIQLFRDTLVTYKASLSIAVGAITLSTATSIDERTRRMESDFKSNLRDIQTKLRALDSDRIELTSIYPQKGSECCGTDAGFALNRFLDYAGSFCNSPPSSFPGSPNLPPLDAATDSNTIMETVLPPAAPDSNTIMDVVLPPKPTPRDNLAKSIYSRSGFDVMKALHLVVSRKNPTVHLGIVDLSSAVMVCDVTMDDCPLIYASDSSQNLTGYSRYELLGRNCRFLQAPDGNVQAGSRREFVDENSVYNLKRMIDERREVQQSIINYRKGGKPFLNLLTIIPIPWDTDEIRYFVGFQVDLVEPPDAVCGQELGGVKVNYIHSDIGKFIWTPPNPPQSQPESGRTLNGNDVSTILQQAYDSTNFSSYWHSQIWHNMLLENIDDVVHIISVKGIFLYVSPSCNKSLEYDAEELVGCNLSSVCHPSDMMPVVSQLKHATPGNPVSLVFRIRRKQSGYTWFESHGSLYVEQGSASKCIMLLGRKRVSYFVSRENLYGNGGISDVEFWSKLSISGLILFISSRVRLLLNLQPECLVGTSIQDLMCKESRVIFLRAINDAKLGKTVSATHRVQNDLGQELLAHTVLYPGDGVKGRKPAFLLAQTKVFRESSYNLTTAGTSVSSTGISSFPEYNAKSRTHHYIDQYKHDYSGKNSMPLTADEVVESEDNIFDELRATRASCWQFELKQLENGNRALAEELHTLVSARFVQRRARRPRG